MELLDILNWSNVGLLFLGIVTGLASAILGIGGGLLMVPVLTYWGATPIEATATSLVAIVIGAFSGTFHNWRSGQLQLNRVMTLAIPAMVSSVIGVALANRLSGQILLLSFAALQLAAIFLIDFKGQLQRKQNQTKSLLQKEVTFSHSREQKRSHNSLLLQSGGIGFLAGVLAGLFGVGGGIVMVPLQMLFLGETIKDAVRISLGTICLIAIAAVTQHAQSGNVLWQAGLCLGVGTLCGAQIGVRLLMKLPEGVVRQLFRGLLAFMASLMMYKAWQI